MRRLLVCAAALGAAACVETGLDVAWTLSFDGDVPTCEQAGAADVRVVSTNLAEQEILTDRFACAAGTGVTQALPPGDYDVAIELLDAASLPIVTVPFPGIPVDDGGLTKLPLVTFRVGGTLFTDWAITQGGVPATCADVGASQLSIFTTDKDGGQVDDLFDCVELYGRTGPLMHGQYTVVVSLIDMNGNTVAQEPAFQATVAADTGTDLGGFSFDFP